MSSGFSDKVVTRFEADISGLQRGLQQVIQQVNGAGRGMQNLGGPVVQRNLQQTSRATDGLRRNLNNNNRELHNSATLLKELQSQTNNTSSSFRMASRSIQTGTNWLDKFSIQADRASMMMWKFTMAGISVKELGVITGVTAAGMGLMLKKMVDSFSIIDRVERQFGSIYKSAELGNGAVAFLTDAAAKIRYSITEVLDAGRLLAMEGFAPKDLVYDMADLAAGVNQEGITIVNATRAFVDATNGQFRRLKETFQITREDAMKFAPDAFSGPNNQISNQAKATEAIIKAIRAKYSGMNAATMQTIQGQMSNLDDAIIKAVAPMGEQLKPILMGWFNSLFGIFDRIEKFGKSGLGGTVAKTMLWGTVILGTVSAVSMLTAGMLSLMGVFAAYKVFMSTRQVDTQNIIKAEMELMAITHEIAAVESQRSLASLGFLKARLVLLNATVAEEKARIALFNAERAGVGVGAARTAWNATTADLDKAKAGVATHTLPKEIIAVQDEIVASKAAEKALSEAIYYEEVKGGSAAQRKVAAINEQLLAQKAVTSELVKQEIALKGQLRRAESIAGTSATGAALGVSGLAAATGGTLVGGFKSGAGAAIKGIGSLFEALLLPLKGLISVVSSAVTAAGGLAAAIGVVAGFAAVLGALAVVGLAIKRIFDGDATRLRVFRAEIENSTTRLKAWTETLQASTTERASSERSQKGLQTLSNVGTKNTLDFGKYAFGKKLLSTSQGDVGAARQMIADIVTASSAAGHNAPKSMRGLSIEDISNLDEETIRKMMVSSKEHRRLVEDINALYNEQNATLIKQGEIADTNAREFATQQLAVEGLAADQKAFYEQVLASTTPAQILALNLHDGFKSSQEMLPEIRDIAQEMEKASDAGKTDAETKAGLVSDLDTAKKSLAEMEESQRALAEMQLELSAEELKSLDAAREKVRILEQQTRLYDLIRKLAEDQTRISMAQSSGMGNLGAVFGGDMAGWERAAAEATNNVKERQRRESEAAQWQRKLIEDQSKQELELRGKKAQAGAAYERLQARVERDRMRRVEREVYKPMLESTTDSGQRKRMQQQIEAEKAVSAAKTLGHETAANNMLLDIRIAKLSAERAMRALSVESEAELLRMDMRILDMKEEQARANNDEVAVLQIKAEKVAARQRAEAATNQLIIERLEIERQMLDIGGASTEDIEKNAQARHDAWEKEAKRLKRQGKDNEAANAQAQADNALKQSRQELLDIEEERLRFLEKEAEMGRASVSDVDAQREKLAKQYDDEANRYKPGSRDNMKFKQKAQEVRGEGLDQIIRQWEAYRREQAMSVESEADLLAIDLQILDLKQQQAKIAGDDAAVRDIEAQKAEARIKAEEITNQLLIERLEIEQQILSINGLTTAEISANAQEQYKAHMQEAERLRKLGKVNDAMKEEVAANAAIQSGRDAAIDIEEEKLALLEKQAERGMASPGQVSKQREAVAKHYDWLASQYESGSSENMMWQGKAMDIRGGGMEDRIGAWEAYRREQSLSVESEADLLEIDMNILDLKEEQAKIAGDENALRDIAVQKIELQRNAEEKINQLLLDRLNLEDNLNDIKGATADDIEKNMQERYKLEMDEAARLQKQGKPVEALKHEVAAQGILKQGRESILGIEEQRLHLMEEQEKRGQVSKGAVARQRESLASHYEWLASQFKTGSEQNMSYLQKAVSMRGQASDEVVDEQLGRLGAKRGMAAARGASVGDLAKIDLEILQTKMKQAKAQGDIVEQMNIQVQAAEKLRELADASLSDEEAKLSFMQTQADQGLISQETVDGEKRRLAQMYTDRANAAAKGSAEYYSNMQKALQLLGDDTAQEWDGIVGKILGAPAELLNNIVSEGGMAKRFGNMDMFGLSGKMQAEIVSQSNRELLVRVNFDSALSTVDARVRAALPAAINVMGQQLVGALSN